MECIVSQSEYGIIQHQIASKREILLSNENCATMQVTVDRKPLCCIQMIPFKWEQRDHVIPDWRPWRFITIKLFNFWNRVIIYVTTEGNEATVSLRSNFLIVISVIVQVIFYGKETTVFHSDLSLSIIVSSSSVGTLKICVAKVGIYQRGGLNHSNTKITVS